MSAVELDDVQLPATEPYRVVIACATYNEHVAVYNEAGEAVARPRYAWGLRGEVINLTKGDAHRLLDLNAVRPADEPKGYEEMDDDELRTLVRARGVSVRSSGADADRPLRTDYIASLQAFDIGNDVAVTGSTGTGGGTTPGGVEIHTNQGESPRGVQGTSAAEFDARGKSVQEVVAWLQAEKPNAQATVAAAHDDPDAASTVLDAEVTASGDDPRATVEKPLQKIIDDGESSC
jgi:hypothetical protein